MRKPTKKSIASKIMLENPNLSLDNVLLKMKRKGCKTTRGTLGSFRYNLKKQGHRLPNWKEQQTGRSAVKLNSKTAAVMKEIFHNPRASADANKKNLAKNGVNVSLDHIYGVKSKMKVVFGTELDFSKKPKPIKLTAAQEKMRPQFKRAINWVLINRVVPASNWPKAKMQEFRQFVLGETQRMIKNYDKTKKSISKYVEMKVWLLRKEYVRQGLMKGMGIKDRDARLLVRIIREKSQGLKDSKKIAKKLECKEKDVRELWEAYQLFLRIQGRLGQHIEEQ